MALSGHRHRVTSLALPIDSQRSVVLVVVGAQADGDGKPGPTSSFVAGWGSENRGHRGGRAPDLGLVGALERTATS